MSVKKFQVLDVGSGKSIAATVFKDILEGHEYDLVTVDINPITNPTLVHDIRKPFPKEMLGRFDLILASHVMEHVERSQVRQTTQNLADTLAHMGELWIVVPSMEWCAERIMEGHIDASIWQCMFGGGEPDMPNYYYHHHGFTLTMLRGMMRHAGLVDRKAYQVPFSISFSHKEGEEYFSQAVADVCIGAKMDMPVETIG